MVYLASKNVSIYWTGQGLWTRSTHEPSTEKTFDVYLQNSLFVFPPFCEISKIIEKEYEALKNILIIVINFHVWLVINSKKNLIFVKMIWNPAHF